MIPTHYARRLENWGRYNRVPRRPASGVKSPTLQAMELLAYLYGPPADVREQEAAARDATPLDVDDAERLNRAFATPFLGKHAKRFLVMKYVHGLPDSACARAFHVPTHRIQLNLESLVFRFMRYVEERFDADTNTSS